MHNLIEFLEETSKKMPDEIAVDDGLELLTFNGLRETSVQIGARIIKKRGISCEKKPIAIFMPKSARCLCAMLGVLYSGNIYVPLDCRAPINRTKAIFEIIKPTLIITDAIGKKQLTDTGIQEESLIDIGEVSAPEHMSYADVPLDFPQNTMSKMLDTDPAYILFTSGSTGVPKGVVIPHRRVINYIKWAQKTFKIKQQEIIGNQAPFYFTVSAMDIYLSQATGAKLVIIQESKFAKPANLLKYIESEKITLIFWVSSVYNHIAQAKALESYELKALKHAWFVGEPMLSQSLHYWLGKLPGVRFVNMYGSTETDMTIYYRVPNTITQIESIPLGQPCANTEILLLKDDHTSAGEGEQGEIYVRGSCLALGYYGDIEKTKAAFMQNPLINMHSDTIYRTGDLGQIRDGLIMFHGRKDHQFKHLGYRIEAGEIEAISSKFEKVKNTCVIYDEKKRQIVLFYEAIEQIDESLFRRFIQTELPIYMVPTRYVELDAMPFNANKKKDRMLLKSQYISTGD